MKENLISFFSFLFLGGSFFSGAWLWAQLADPNKVSELARVSPTAAMVIGGMALATGAVALVLIIFKEVEGDKKEVTEEEGVEMAWKKFRERKIFFPPPRLPPII